VAVGGQRKGKGGTGIHTLTIKKGNEKDSSFEGERRKTYEHFSSRGQGEGGILLKLMKSPGLFLFGRRERHLFFK